LKDDGYGENMLTKPSTRLNKYISESGICSRRDADRYIEQGNVFINGKRVTLGDQVFPGDVVKVNGQLIEPRNEDKPDLYRAEQAGRDRQYH
jgi:23S rRNA pseudouridine2604 synthase